MKIVAVLAAVVGALLALMVIPLVLISAAAGSGGAQAAAGVAAGCVYNNPQLTRVLATIRSLESGGNYAAQAAGSSASGAYQFIDSTWRSFAAAAGVDVQQYPRAVTAPPEVQDTVAAAHVTEILDANDNNVAAVPVVWYIGRVPPEGSADWDTVPAPDAGNVLTPRQYVEKWMTAYNAQAAGTDVEGDDAPLSIEAVCSVDPETGAAIADPSVLGPPSTSTDGLWANPLPADQLTSRMLHGPHHDYPAIDIMVPEGTPVYAVRGGTVTTVTNFGKNWWAAGCKTNGAGGCQSCGIGITIRTDNASNTRFTYCHLSARAAEVAVGAAVTVGQPLGLSGDTGRSGAPHLHVEIRTGDTQRCPQNLLDAIFLAGPVPEPTSLPTTGCSF